MSAQVQRPPILVATGGGAHSTAAVKAGAYLAQLCRRPLALLTVARTEAEAASGGRASAAQADAQQILADFRLPLECEMRMRVGERMREILAEAELDARQILVLGERHPHQLFTRFVLGSLAQRILERVTCPVLLAKGRIGPIRRVLICDSGLQKPSLLSRVVARLPDLLAGHPHVTVLHVMSQISAGPGVQGRPLRASAEELIAAQTPEGDFLARDRRLLASVDCACHTKVRHGLVVEEILREARQGNYDLVLVGAHPGGAWQRLLLDNITHRLLASLDRPVLVMPLLSNQEA